MILLDEGWLSIRQTGKWNRCQESNGVFTPEQDNDKTNVEPVHSYDAIHTVLARPGVKRIIGIITKYLYSALTSTGCSKALHKNY